MEIARENLHSIIKYKAVLSKLLKKPVSLEQAMADWLEQGYHLKQNAAGTADKFLLN